MSIIENITKRLQAKSEIRQANSQIRQARSIMNTPQAALNMPFLQFLRSKPWAISSEGFKDLASHANSEKLEIQFSDFFNLRPETTIRPDGVAVIHIHNALVDGGPPILAKLGLVTEYKTIIADVRDVTEKGAKSIRLVVNSPGGTVAGLREAADEIAKSKIPVTAFCSGLACSAAYWLISSAKKITASPSATVGNIGALISWANDDEFWASMGITWNALVSEGADLKSTFHLEPNDVQLKFLQESINEAGAAFKAHVTKHRPGINAEVFRAGWYSGERALSLGLVDAIGTLEGSTSKGSTAPAKATAPKDDGLTITSAEFDALPPSDKAEFKRLGGKTATASVVTPPAPVKPIARTIINPPVSKPEMVSSEKPVPAPARQLFGIDKAVAAHRGESVSHAPPVASSGLQRAIEIHKAQAAKARK